MQEIPIQYNAISLIHFIGIFLGFFLSYFFIRKSWRRNVPNLIMGFFILAMTVSMLEGWLNYTRLIFKVLWLTNFAEPTNFIIAPLIYFFVISQFKKVSKTSYLLHFLPFGFWILYCMFFYMQTEAFKYNSNIDVMQLQVPELSTTQLISDNPLYLRNYVNILTGISFVIYVLLSINVLIHRAKELKLNFWNTPNNSFRSLRNSLYHFLIIIVIFISVKLVFKNDVGDYIIYIYLTFMLFLTLVNVTNNSSYFNEVSTFLEGPVLKYKKSSLLDYQKEEILENILHQMNREKYFIKSTASLSGLSKAINQSSHHVSQVINEKLQQSFFEMIAAYRIEEAKLILKSDLGKKLTIEEISERVGYNSKSAFNTTFKKITSHTPSSFRDS